MIENLALIGIGFVLGAITMMVVLYVGGKALVSRKLDRMTTSLDRAQKLLDNTEPPDPEKLLRMMREVEDLEDDDDPFGGVSPESS